MAGKYSNRIRATKFNPSGMTRKQVNLQKKRIFVPELNKTITVTVSTQVILDKQIKNPGISQGFLFAGKHNRVGGADNGAVLVGAHQRHASCLQAAQHVLCRMAVGVFGAD